MEIQWVKALQDGIDKDLANCETSFAVSAGMEANERPIDPLEVRAAWNLRAKSPFVFLGAFWCQKETRGDGCVLVSIGSKPFCHGSLVQSRIRE